MKAAPALWLLLPMAGAKLTDDRCDPTRERDDAMCLRNGKRDPKCCACLGTGSCRDGYAYETDSYPCLDWEMCAAWRPRDGLLLRARSRAGDLHGRI